MSPERHDVVVVGGSFAGLAAALQLARARRRVLVVDAGLRRNRFSEAAHGFLGQDGRPPGEIVADARAQLLAYPTATIREDTVVDAADAAGGWRVTLADGPAVEAARLILATGVVDVLPEVPGLAERWGKAVLHCPYCHGYEFADRALGVLATSPLAIHQAMLVREWGPTTLFGSGAFVPDEEQRAALAARGIPFEPVPVAALEGPAGAIEAVRLADGRRVPLAALYIAPRSLPPPLAERLGCAFDDGPFGPVIRADERRQTTVPGVYAAGDAARLMPSVSGAVADGVTAGVFAHQSMVFPAAA